MTPVPDDHTSEPNAAVTEVADETEMPLPSDPRTFFLGGLFALGALAALYVASSIILPVVLALVLNLLLQPAVRLLGRVHVPRAVGALLTVFLVIGALVGLVAALSVPAATWAERLPEGIPRLEAHLEVIKGPIQALQKIIQQAEQAADAPLAGVRSFRFAAILASRARFSQGRAPSLMACLRLSWCSIFFWWPATYSFDASLRSCRRSATSGRPSISRSRSRRTYRPIW